MSKQITIDKKDYDYIKDAVGTTLSNIEEFDEEHNICPGLLEEALKIIERIDKERR